MKWGVMAREILRGAALAATALIAVREAALARLRPILMTTLATILGILPIALALGAAAESRVSMGIAVIGGLTVGGCMTLFVIPAIYTLVAAKTTHAPAAEPMKHAAVERVTVTTH